MAKGKKITKDNLTLEQERFCQAYASEAECFGSGVESYILAFNTDPGKKNARNYAMSAACRLLKNESISKRIAELLTLNGYSDNNADKQLAFVISQHADLGAKVQAIREYNKLKNRISDNITIKHEIIDPGKMTKSEIDKYLAGK